MSKKLVFVVGCITAIVIISLVGCDAEDEPGDYLYLFEIVDRDQGIDYFETHLGYTFSETKIYVDTAFKRLHINTNYYDQNKNLIVFSPLAIRVLYIDYGNGDVDTLTHLTHPIQKEGTLYAVNSDQTFFFFNGEKQLTLDFQKYDTLRKMLIRRNNRKSKEFDPLVFQLRK